MAQGNPENRRDHPHPRRRTHQATLHFRRVHHVRPPRSPQNGGAGLQWKKPHPPPHGLAHGHAFPAPAGGETPHLPDRQLKRAGGHRPQTPWQARPLLLHRHRTRSRKTHRTRQVLRSHRKGQARPRPEPDHRPRLQPPHLRKPVRLLRLRPLRSDPPRHRQGRCPGPTH